MQIINRYTGDVITQGDMQLRELVVHYVDSQWQQNNRPDLIGANLGGADLRGANLGDADLRGANLRGADLRDADLRDADLIGANLGGADLRGANLRKAGKIKKCAVFSGLYKYIVMPIIAADGVKWVRLGCYTRTVADWDVDFWNNPGEFPNNGDIPSKLRWMAYQTCLQWFAIMDECKE